MTRDKIERSTPKNSKSKKIGAIEHIVMTYGGWKVLASHFWGFLTTTFCFMPRICSRRSFRSLILLLNSQAYSSICWIRNFYDFVWETFALSLFFLFSQSLSPTCKSYRKTVAPAPGTRRVCIHSASFPLLFRWWIKTFDISLSLSFEYRPFFSTFHIQIVQYS